MSSFLLEARLYFSGHIVNLQRPPCRGRPYTGGFLHQRANKYRRSEDDRAEQRKALAQHTCGELGYHTNIPPHVEKTPTEAFQRFRPRRLSDRKLSFDTSTLVWLRSWNT